MWVQASPGAQRYRAPAVPNRLRNLALRGQRPDKIGVRGGVERPQPCRPAIADRGPLGIAALLQQSAQLPVRNAALGIERDHAAKERQRFIRLAPLVADHRQPLDRIHVVRVLGQDGAVDRLRLGQAPGAVMLGCR